jgi:hypothetical protein
MSPSTLSRDKAMDVNEIIEELRRKAESPRGKLYTEITKLHAYVVRAEEDGFDKYMVMEDEYKVVAEAAVALITALRQLQEAIDPRKSYIKEVKP